MCSPSSRNCIASFSPGGGGKAATAAANSCSNCWSSLKSNAFIFVLLKCLPAQVGVLESCSCPRQGRLDGLLRPTATRRDLADRPASDVFLFEQLDLLVRQSGQRAGQQRGASFRFRVAASGQLRQCLSVGWVLPFGISAEPVCHLVPRHAAQPRQHRTIAAKRAPMLQGGKEHLLRDVLSRLVVWREAERDVQIHVVEMSIEYRLRCVIVVRHARSLSSTDSVRSSLPIPASTRREIP